MSDAQILQIPPDKILSVSLPAVRWQLAMALINDGAATLLAELQRQLQQAAQKPNGEDLQQRMNDVLSQQHGYAMGVKS
jgi:hypothetical protein